jgi:hypothetical protein
LPYALVLTRVNVQAVRVSFWLHVLREPAWVVEPESAEDAAVEGVDREYESRLRREPAVILRHILAAPSGVRPAFGGDR